MRNIIIPTIAALGLMAAPAFAQSGSSSTTQHNSNSTTMQHNGQQSGQHESVQQVEQTLRSDLSKAGYSNIHIVPGSFLVRATNGQGQQTEMMISPNSVTAVTAMGSQGQNGSSGSSSGSSTGSSNSTKQ